MIQSESQSYTGNPNLCTSSRQTLTGRRPIDIDPPFPVHIRGLHTDRHPLRRTRCRLALAETERVMRDPHDLLLLHARRVRELLDRRRRVRRRPADVAVLRRVHAVAALRVAVPVRAGDLGVGTVAGGVAGAVTGRLRRAVGAGAGDGGCFCHFVRQTERERVDERAVRVVEREMKQCLQENDASVNILILSC